MGASSPVVWHVWLLFGSPRFGSILVYTLCRPGCRKRDLSHDPNGGCLASSRVSRRNQGDDLGSGGLCLEAARAARGELEGSANPRAAERCPSTPRGSHQTPDSLLCACLSPLCYQGYALVFGNTGQASEIRPLGVSRNPVAACEPWARNLPATGASGRDILTWGWSMQHQNKIIQFLMFSNMDVGVLQTYVLQDFEPGSIVSINSGEIHLADQISGARPVAVDPGLEERSKIVGPRAWGSGGERGRLWGCPEGAPRGTISFASFVPLASTKAQ